MNKKIILIGMAGAAALLLNRMNFDPEDTPQYEAPLGIEAIEETINEWIDMPADVNEQVANSNINAFLWMIRVSEGTSGPEGYRTLVGGSLFDSFADHPRVLISLPNLGIKSSAAGAYQILRRTWDGVRGKLGLTDFSPESQDSAAIELVRQRGALNDVKAGRFAIAVDKCKKEWASLPGAGYGQHENTLTRLQAAYTSAGGYLA